MNLLIRNIPREIHEQLKEVAREHHRSLSSEVLNIIEHGIRRLRPIQLKDLPPRIKAKRPFSADDMERWINQGQK